MSQQPISDLLARLARLAEAELECRCALQVNPYCLAPHFTGALGHDPACPRCQSAGYYVPFKALRVLCPCLAGGTSQGGCAGCYHRRNHTSCDGCEGRGWIPEPDLARACWLIVRDIPIDREDVHTGADIIQAAEAWLEEQR